MSVVCMLLFAVLLYIFSPAAGAILKWAATLAKDFPFLSL